MVGISLRSSDEAKESSSALRSFPGPIVFEYSAISRPRLDFSLWGRPNVQTATEEKVRQQRAAVELGRSF